jgi:hypothetical protein
MLHLALFLIAVAVVLYAGCFALIAVGWLLAVFVAPIIDAAATVATFARNWRNR